VTKLNHLKEDDVNYSLIWSQATVKNFKQENDKALNEDYSFDSGSFLFSSSDNEHDDDRREEKREGFENDWNLSSLKSCFSSSDDHSLIESVLDVFNVVDPAEEEEEDLSFVFTESDDQEESDDDSIDIEGNCILADKDDMDSFNSSHRERNEILDN
jgi:hypothetical protein